MSAETDRRGVSPFYVTYRSPDFYKDRKTMKIYRKSRLSPQHIAKKYGKLFTAWKNMLQRLYVKE